MERSTKQQYQRQRRAPPTIQATRVLLTFSRTELSIPLVSKDIKTNESGAVDIGMVYASREGNFGRFEWIVGWKLHIQEEESAFIGCSGLLELILSVHGADSKPYRTHDDALPIHLGNSE